MLKEDNKRFAYQKDIAKLCESVKQGCGMIAIRDFSIDRKLIAQMQGKEAMLLIPISEITSCAGFSASRLMYKARMLIRYAKSKRIKIIFCTLAQNKLQACSSIQIIEMAKMLGADKKMIDESFVAMNEELGE